LPASGATALHAAADKCHTHVVRALLAHGAHPQPALIGSCATPLHAACTNGDVATARLLLMNGASPFAALFPSGTTPLDIAAKTGNAELLTLFTAFGVNVAAVPAMRRPPSWPSVLQLSTSLHGGTRQATASNRISSPAVFQLSRSQLLPS